jgi:hypothetical protein
LTRRINEKVPMPLSEALNTKLRLRLFNLNLDNMGFVTGQLRTKLNSQIE